MVSAGLTIGFVLIQTFCHQGSPISVQGILNGLAAQGHGRGGISQGMSYNAAASEF